MSRRILFSLAAATLILGASSPAFAWVSYQLGDNYYAIRCNDGTLHSYSGGAGGLGIVGPALCEGHGGLVVDPKAGGPKILPATKDILGKFPDKAPPVGRSINESGVSVKSSVKNK